MVTPTVQITEVDPTHLVARLLDPPPGSTGAEATAHLVEGRWDLRLERDGLRTESAGQLVRSLVLRCGLTGHPPVWWVEDADDEADEIAHRAGLVCDRELFQMRCRLPLDQHTSVSVRPFRRGADEAAWLEVNNAAFGWHEEQGGWDRARLEDRMGEPWFDPDGFLVHEHDGRLAAFCWTKEHRSAVPPMGEIFVIGVHPELHGLGLGRALTLAGLDHLADRGLPVGMLYVESTNEPAVGLYRSLGFTVHHHDRRYRIAGDDEAQAVLTPNSDPTA
jgi:mycothiol synthase